MKKIVLALFFIFFTQEIKALEIQNIEISTLSNQEISITIHSTHEYIFQYISHQYSTLGNEITLEICYTTGLLPTISELENNFQFPLDTTTPSNYTLVVKAYFINFQTFVCDYQDLRDLKSLSFATPLSGSVFLTVSDFAQNEQYPLLHPNPTNGVLYCNSKERVKKIQVYNFMGQLLFEIESPIYELDCKSLVKGSYIFIIETSNKRYVNRIIKN